MLLLKTDCNVSVTV